MRDSSTRDRDRDIYHGRTSSVSGSISSSKGGERFLAAPSTVNNDTDTDTTSSPKRPPGAMLMSRALSNSLRLRAYITAASSSQNLTAEYMYEQESSESDIMKEKAGVRLHNDGAAASETVQIIVLSPNKPTPTEKSALGRERPMPVFVQATSDVGHVGNSRSNGSVNSIVSAQTQKALLQAPLQLSLDSSPLFGQAGVRGLAGRFVRGPGASKIPRKAKSQSAQWPVK